MATAAKPASTVIQIKRPQRGIIRVPIIGETPLIPHKWSEKAKTMMRDKQMQVGVEERTEREPKNPDQEAYDATYWMPDGRGAMPAVAFKAAMVGACRLHTGLTMTVAKTALFVQGEGTDMLVPIDGEYEIREDTPRNSNGQPDLRYRNYFFPWSAWLEVHFLKAIVNQQSVVNLIESAGYGGIGDWRPSAPKSATGTFGRFRVNEREQVQVIRE